ncbi:MAG TPA: response regulator [Candidatus Angelobacter sp.]|nr:response regulator [Candidatus Angelobacter sp.]
MSGKFKYRVLLVDDDETLLQTTADVLTREGYLVQIARDGFEALTVLRGGQPEIVVSDLNIPNMSGFELLAVIRKRFPGIGVIAYSGEFSPLGPEGVLADRFLRKGENSTFELLEEIRDLLEELPLRSQQAKPDTAPAWLPRSATEYVVVTCPFCLRSFSVSTRNIEFGTVHQDVCLHCGAEVAFRLDSTTAAEPPTLKDRLRTQIEASRRTIDHSRGMIGDSKLKIEKIDLPKKSDKP